MAKRAIKKVRGWNLHQDGITQGFINTWLSCRATAVLRYMQMWTPTATTKPLEFGNSIHRAMEVAYALSKVPDPDFWVTEMVHYIEEISIDPMVQKQWDLYREQSQIAAAVLPGYASCWETDWDKKAATNRGIVSPKKWVALEKVFSVKMCGIRVRGKFDGVFEDKKDQLWVLDTKARGQWDPGLLSRTMVWDTQSMLYLRAAKHLWPDKKVAGFVLNNIRRPSIRQKQNETWEQYLERVREVHQEPEDYDKNFQRLQLRVSQRDSNRWWDEFLVPCLTAILDWWEGKATTYMTPGALIGRYGPSSYLNALTYGDYSNLYQRSSVFPELDGTEIEVAFDV